MSHAAAKRVRVQLRTHPDYTPPRPHLRLIQGGPQPRTDDERLISRTAAADLEAVWVRQSRVDPNAFAQYAFGYDQAWFHEQWQQAMTDHPRVAIRTHRGSGKTEQGAIVRVIWELGRNPDLAIGIVCATDTNAVERVKVIKHHIERNPRVQRVFPWLRLEQDEGGKHRFTVVRRHIRKDASVEAIGIGSTPTGGRKDLIVGDDVCNARNSLHIPALRTQVRQSWNGDIVPLLLPGGRIWYLHTGWSPKDLSNDIITNPEYHVIRIVVGSRFEAPWPELWNSRLLYSRWREMGSIEFNRGYRDILSDLSAAIIRPEWLHYMDPAAVEADIEWVLSYDVCTGDDTTKDGSYFAGTIFAVIPSLRKILVFDSYRRRMSLPEQERQIVADWQQFGQSGTVVIESIGGYGGVPQHLREIAPAMKMFAIKKVTGSKTQRLEMTSPLFENGIVHFADRMEPTAVDPERGDLVSDILDFVNCKYKDQGDSLSLGLDHIRKVHRFLGAPMAQAGRPHWRVIGGPDMV